MSTMTATMAASGSRAKRSSPAENWDDDFEFALPVKTNGATTPKRDSLPLADLSNANVPETPDSWAEDWDEPDTPPVASRAAIPSASAQQEGSGLTYTHSPRISPSISPSLPTTSSASSSNRPQAEGLASPSSASIKDFRAAISQDPTIRKQSSAHLPRTETPTRPTASQRKSSPNLAQARAWSQGPVGNLPRPSGYASTRRSPSKSQSTSPDSSPSKDGRKPKFWSRFSSGPSATPVPDGRMRSTSVGARPVSTLFVDPDAPPVPALPPNHRSSSNGSHLSNSSAVSSIARAGGRDSSAKKLSTMLKRSSSNLSSALNRVNSASPTGKPTSLRDQASVLSADIDVPATPIADRYLSGSPAKPNGNDLQDPTVCTPQRPRMVKSPSEGADTLYIPTPTQTSRRPRPLSSRFTGLSLRSDPRSGSDAEPDALPTRLRRNRPTSISLPSTEATATTHDEKTSVPSSPVARRSFASARAWHPTPSSQAPEASGSGSRPSSAQSTLTRIASFSKKHGRRLSGGWKFGTGSSTSSGESRPDARTALQPHPLSVLEPVEASPVKPLEGIATPDTERAIDFSEAQGSSHQREVSGSQDPASWDSSDVTATPRPGDVMGPPETPKAKDTASADGHRRNISPSAWQFKPMTAATATFPDWQSPSQRRAKTERRRASLNDNFVIPERVLAAQKGLKRDKVALKEFAEQVKALQSLLRAHDKVCDHIIASGSVSETQLFATLENEYGEWLEWAALLIDIGSTGTEGHGTAPDVRTRRITLAAGDARRHSEALRSISGVSVASTGTFSSLKTGRSSVHFSSSEPSTEGSSNDLSRRQLEMLHAVLESPAPKTHPDSSKTPISRHSAPVSRKQPSVSPDHLNYEFPSPSYPSPKTAAQYASQQPRRGLSGIRDFLRAFKHKPTPSKPPRRVVEDVPEPKPVEKSPPESPSKAAGPADMLYNTFQSEKPNLKKRRPSVRRIFRHGSGNWNDIVRSDPPAPPADNAEPQLAKPPSVPALVRLNPKAYPGLGVEPASPTQASMGVDLPPFPLKSRVSGLGHPADASPSRASSSPARADHDLVADDVPLRSRSDGARVLALEITPESLPGLLEQAKECERMLGEWKVRAGVLGAV